MGVSESERFTRALFISNFTQLWLVNVEARWTNLYESFFRAYFNHRNLSGGS